MYTHTHNQLTFDKGAKAPNEERVVFSENDAENWISIRKEKLNPYSVSYTILAQNRT